jgi:hypothetical protein
MSTMSSLIVPMTRGVIGAALAGGDGEGGWPGEAGDEGG